MTVHLNRVVDHDAVAVVVGHHVLGEGVNGVLNPRFFGIDHHATASLGGGLAQRTDAPLDALPRRLVFSVQGLAARHRFPHLLEKDVGGQSTHLEHGKGMSGVAIRSLNGGQDLAARGVEVGLGGLAFGAVVEDGANVVGRQLRHGLLGIVDGFSPTKVGVHGGLHRPSQGDPQREGEVGEGTACIHEPRLSDQRKQGHSPTQFGVAQVLKGLRRVVELGEVRGAHCHR